MLTIIVGPFCEEQWGGVIAEAGKTTIGDNVFIGMNSIVLMGAAIGNNVIIGAGSIVNGKIPDNVVAAGNPARIICTLEQFYEKRKSLYIDEAALCAREYYSRYGKKPSIQEMGAFFPIYLERSKKALQENHIFTKLSGDDGDDVINEFLQSEPVFDSYDAFLNYALKEK